MHIPALIQDLAIILGIAAVITFIFKRIKQPVVLGYVLAGIIVGPFTPPFFSVTDTSSIKVWAELGVIFLMFSLGLEFSFRRLAHVGLSAGFTAIVEITAMLFLGFIVGRMIGFNTMNSIFLGCMIAISSTTVILKSFEEMNLKSKRFSELVIGILIVEDLVAILLLVALTNIISSTNVSGLDLLITGGKLIIIISIWFIIGIFIVPRFIKSVGKHGNDEMLIIVAIGLCLSLVAVAAQFQYSAALGAFIMGSILAESTEAKKIEHLIRPLKDIFGAVFFVSVGMLLNPGSILDNFFIIIIVTCVIVFGKLFFVSFGTFLTGQTLRNSMQTGFSLGQVGEFSFIIASLGIAFHVLNNDIYPIIVAASVLTTFTTPYLIKISVPLINFIDRNLPETTKNLMISYAAWVQRRALSNKKRSYIYKAAIKWGLNTVAVLAIFTISANQLVPLALKYIPHISYAKALVWLIAFILSSPSLWAMTTSFKFKIIIDDNENNNLPKGGLLLVSRLLTIFILGILSIEYFPAMISLALTLAICIILLLLFRKQAESYYQWLEMQFQAGFQADIHSKESNEKHQKLAPWDGHIVELKIPARSIVIAKSLLQLKLRELYNINILLITRDNEIIFAPKAHEILYPSDKIQCFGADHDIENFKNFLSLGIENKNNIVSIDNFHLVKFKIETNATVVHKTIQSSKIHEEYNCIIVGLERSGQKINNPKSDTLLINDDLVWLVGDNISIKKVTKLFKSYEKKS